jgi:hypothetical protein
VLSSRHVHQLDDDEDGGGNDQEIDYGVDKQTVVDNDRGRGFFAGRIHNVRLQLNDLVGKIDTAGEHSDRRHHHVFDQGINHRAERRADHDAHCQIDDAPLHRELFEFFQQAHAGRSTFPKETRGFPGFDPLTGGQLYANESICPCARLACARHGTLLIEAGCDMSVVCNYLSRKYDAQTKGIARIVKIENNHRHIRMDVSRGGPQWVPEQRIALSILFSAGLYAFLSFIPLANDRAATLNAASVESVVPEPSSLALLAAGLGIIVVVKARGRWFR